MPAFTRSSAISRDFPTPASPSSSKDWPRPEWRSSAARSSVAASASRPTSGVSIRSRSEVLRRISLHAGTGASRPFSDNAPTGSSENRGISRRAVLSPTRIVPGSAAAWIRAAMLVMSPSTTDRGWAAPTAPTAASPLLMPTRTLNSSIPHAWRMSSAYAATVASTASPDSAARSGSSSCADGTPKQAQMPSPMYDSTTPPYSSTARLMRVMHSPTRAFTSSGRSRSPSPVEPTMSANSAVTGRSSSTPDADTDRRSSAAPHDPQVVAPGGALLSHDGQITPACLRGSSGRRYALGKGSSTARNGAGPSVSDKSGQ